MGHSSAINRDHAHQNQNRKRYTSFDDPATMQALAALTIVFISERRVILLASLQWMELSPRPASCGHSDRYIGKV